MKDEWTTIMVKSKRLKLTTMQTLTHYGIVIFLLLAVSMIGKSLIEIYITDTYTGVLTVEEIIKLLLPFLALAVIFATIQYRRLRFKEFQVSYTEEQFQEAIERTVKDLEWNIKVNNRSFFRSIRPWNWTGSWGEMVTIIKDKDRLLINSICDPDQMSSPASYGWNRKNIRTFLKNLSDVLNGRPQEVKVEKVTNEWSFKRILIRILAYPFCIFLIVFGIYMILEPLTFRSVIAGFGAIVVASVYLYSDIKILTTGYTKKRNPTS